LDGEKPTGPPMSPIAAIAALKPHTKQCLWTMAGVGATMGIHLGDMAGALLFMKDSLNLSFEEQEIVMGALYLSTGLAALCLGWVCHKWGCVRASMLAVTLYSVGAGIVSMSYNIVMLLVGRLVLGVGVGLTFVTVNLYLVDIAPVKLRGATVMVFELSLCVGLTLGCVVTLMFMSLPPDYSWRVMVACPLPQGVLLLVALLRIPETPRFLMNQGLEDEARLVLQHTVDDEDVELVMSGIKQSMQEAEGTTDVTMAEIMFCPRPLARKGVWLALMLAFFQQATGSELLVNYVPEMMEDAGVTTITMQVISSMVVGMFRVFMVILGTLLVDDPSWGRRSLLLFSVAGVTATKATLSLAEVLPPEWHPEWWAILSMVGYISFLSVGMGPMTWLLASELLPARERSLGIALCSFINRETSGVVSASYLSMREIFSTSGTLLIYLIITIFYLFLVWLLIPETKNMSLEQIQHFLQYGDDPANRPSNPDTDGLQSLIDPAIQKSSSAGSVKGYGSTVDGIATAPAAVELRLP